MPYVGRLVRRLIQGQGGSTLIELLVAMPLAVGLLGVVFQGFSVGSLDQQRVEARSETVILAQEGLERMTRALRQANWVYFRSSSVVDFETLVRPGPTSEAIPRLMRFDCSTGVCVEWEGQATAFPPPAAPALRRRAVLIGAVPGDRRDRAGRLEDLDVFHPGHVDEVTGRVIADYLDPDYVMLRVRVRPATADRAAEIVDGVALRNHGGRR